MRNDIKLINLKGFNTPDFTEKAGDQYKQAMSEIRQKVEQKRKLKTDSMTNIKKKQDEINKIKNQIIMSEDDFEEMQLKGKRKQLKEELENIDDYSGLDVDEYARKLINNEKITKLRSESIKEYQDTLNVAKPYVTELEKQYRQATKLLNQFSAGMDAESSFREADVQYNRYKNN